jgi:uncharacterized protein
METVIHILERLIKRQKIEINQWVDKNYLEREVLPSLLHALDSPLVKVILGPRRCGKSTLAKKAIQNRKFAYLNFEDEGFPLEASGEDIIAALELVYPNAEILFFDEIQNLHRWEQFVHRLHREGRNLVVTGSNAHLLSQELSSALTGRHIAINVLPFSYKEFLGKNRVDSEEQFLSYLNHGGYPEIVTGASQASFYLGTLWDSIILKDIVRRHKIRNVRDLHALYNAIVHSIASRFNNDSLVRALSKSVSGPTVKKFLMFGEQAYLFADLNRFHFGARKRLKFDRKAYIYDNGFLLAKKITTSPDKGRLLENLVFIELVRRGYTPGLNLFYFVSQSGYEVDFLTFAGSKAEQLIQVTWQMTEAKTREREIRALEAASKEINATQTIIITFDHKETLQIKDLSISAVPIREWLLN